jgi:type I restriction enzyme S subunit
MTLLKMIPQTWEITTLGNVYQVIGGGTPSTEMPDYWDGDVPWITSADIEGVRQIKIRKYVTEKGIKESTTNKVPPKTLLVVTRVGLGKIGITETPICFSQDLQGLIQDPKFICPEYTLYLLSYKLQYLKFDGRGTTISGITKKQLTDLEFPLPPLPEQYRIVAKIEALFSELDKGIESFNTAREQLKIYRQALLKHAFSGKLTEQWRAENADAAQGCANAAGGQEPGVAKLESAETLLQRIQAERQQRYRQQLKDWEQSKSPPAPLLQRGEQAANRPADPSATTIPPFEKGGLGGISKPKAPKTLPPLTAEELAELPELPEGWIYSYLADLGDLGRGKSKHRPRNDPRLFGGVYPFIQTGEVKAANRIIREYTNTLSDFGLQQSKLWPSGTLCITIAANIAETAFLGFDGCFPDSVVGFSAFEPIVAPEYVDFFIQAVRARIEAYAPATAQKNINLETLENLVVPYCCLNEQRQIIEVLEERFSILDQFELSISDSLQQAEALRQSILKKAFSGQLVPQDPNDEPASVLLERIQAEKIAITKQAGAKIKANEKSGEKHENHRIG